MKKIIPFIIVMVMLGHTLSAQETPTVAPNFIVTDINGETHELYDVLASGKTVVIDFFTTWCPPCWDYHNGKELSKLWNRHGPDGLDDYFVMGIECDGSTGLDDLRGTGTNTLGDWTEDVDYPIIDNDQIRHYFNISLYPTFVQICTDRTAVVVDRGFFNPNGFDPTNPKVEDYVTQRLDCSTPQSPINVTAYAYNGYDGNICDATSFMPIIDFRNSGTDLLTSCNAELYVDNVLTEEMLWTGSLKSYQHDQITFSEITVSKKAKIEIKLSSPNGQSDDDLTDNTLIKNINEVNIASTSNLLLEIRTNIFGKETYWAILDDSDMIIAEGGNPLVGLDNIGNINIDAPDHPSAYGYQEIIEETIELTNDGCYRFVITDFKSNGICCNSGVGRYILKDESGLILASGGEFRDREEHYFRYGEGLSSTFSNKLDADVTIWPNPVSDILHIDIETAKALDVEVQMTNLHGYKIQRTTESINSGKNYLKYDMSQYPAGVYYLSILSENGRISKKIIKD